MNNRLKRYIGLAGLKIIEDYNLVIKSKCNYAFSLSFYDKSNLYRFSDHWNRFKVNFIPERNKIVLAVKDDTGLYDYIKVLEIDRYYFSELSYREIELERQTKKYLNIFSSKLERTFITSHLPEDYKDISLYEKGIELKNYTISSTQLYDLNYSLLTYYILRDNLKEDYKDYLLLNSNKTWKN